MQILNTSAVKNSVLCKKELGMIPNGNFTVQGLSGLPNIVFLKIKGVTSFWESEKDLDVSTLGADILNSFVRQNLPFIFAIVGSGSGISIYVGTIKPLRNTLKTSYESLYPGIEIEAVDRDPLSDLPASFGGMITGVPTNKLGAEKKTLQIESVCRGMQGKNFAYIICAFGLGPAAAAAGHERILNEMSGVYPLIAKTVSGGPQGNQSAQMQDFAAKNYFENLEALEKALNVGIARGLWRMCGYYAADSHEDSVKLGSIIKASFSGDESKPEPFRTIEYNYIREIIARKLCITEQIAQPENHPLWDQHDAANGDIGLFFYKYQTVLNSDQLAALCQLPTKEFPGYYVDEYVEFDVSNRVSKPLEHPLPLGSICYPGRRKDVETNNKYSVELNDLTRHALIIGITGGGKTNTSKSMLQTLWTSEYRIPFMVIESAKREYWELRNLKGFEDLLVFTLGAEASQTSVRYRINPFETNPAISLQTHIDYLLSTFKAAFDMVPPMPYILEKAVYAIYDDRGWDIVENTNRYGFTEYPTLSDLYNKIGVIVDSMGYHQEVQSNVKAALQARVYSLMIGGKGAMLNTHHSVPIGELLSRPVVMELEDLGDDETKSFVIGILLVQLYEYRKSQMTSGSKSLSHVLMVEEAHRLLKNVPEVGEGSNTRAKSVEFFCNMLAEIRTFGQGIMIADQIPTKLAPDTIKNTNLKIVHRTVALEDRETIGRAMNMSEDQIGYLSSLNRGYAAVYAEGDNRPKCVKFPLLESSFHLGRAEVISEVKRKVNSIAAGYDRITDHHCGCSFCEHRCRYYNVVSEYLTGNVDLSSVLNRLAVYMFSPSHIASFLSSTPMKHLPIENDHVLICVLGYVLSKYKDLTDGQRQKIIADYLRFIHKR